MSKRKTAQKTGDRLIVADNRRARFDYELIETFEAGLALQGTEVKSLRAGKAGLGESYATMEGNELKLINAYIPEYGQANRFNHEPRRARKLLMHRRQIDRLAGAIQKDGLTIVPIRIYFNADGRAKAEIALARGRKAHDKREHLKERSWARDKARILRDRG